MFTTMHCSGFAQWATDISHANGTGGFNYAYSTRYSGGAAVDVVDSFVASCERAGVLPGFYYSLNENYYLVRTCMGARAPFPADPPSRRAARMWGPARCSPRRR